MAESSQTLQQPKDKGIVTTENTILTQAATVMSPLAGHSPTLCPPTSNTAPSPGAHPCHPTVYLCSCPFQNVTHRAWHVLDGRYQPLPVAMNSQLAAIREDVTAWQGPPHMPRQLLCHNNNTSNSTHNRCVVSAFLSNATSKQVVCGEFAVRGVAKKVSPPPSFYAV
jgi:hypothetical protein